MANKQKDGNRTYKPKKIRDTIGIINKKYINKFGKIDYIIYSKWEEIVGSFFKNHSEPKKIISIKEENDNSEAAYYNYLLVNVTPSAALEFQHFKDKIIEKINSYFGYKAIKGIKISQKIIENKATTPDITKNNLNSFNKYINTVKKETNKIKNKNLEESILNLGLSINNKE